MKAFDGVRVLEFGQVIAGPFCAAALGYLGADVIKVEPPGTGDQSRRLMDTGPLSEAGMAPLFQGLNAGKRSLTLDLKHPQAGDVVQRLVESADVLVENARPGVLERLGLGYDALRAIRPDLIYCSISGYGQTGPRREAPAYDGAVQAASGMMTLTGNPGDGPMRVGFAVVDATTALTAAYAIAGALYRRARTGEGQYLDVSMLDTALSLLAPAISNYLIGGTTPTQIGNSSLTLQPTGNVFDTREGAIQINAVTEPQVRALCAAIGRADLLEDPRFATVEGRLAHSREIHAVLAAALAERTAREWEPLLSAAGVPVARVLSIPEVLKEPQLADRDILIEFPPVHEAQQAPTTVVNLGFRAATDGPGPATPPPRLGQDTDAVLAELGYDAAEIAALRSAGVV